MFHKKIQLFSIFLYFYASPQFCHYWFSRTMTKKTFIDIWILCHVIGHHINFQGPLGNLGIGISSSDRRQYRHRHIKHFIFVLRIFFFCWKLEYLCPIQYTSVFFLVLRYHCISAVFKFRISFFSATCSF